MTAKQNAQLEWDQQTAGISHAAEHQFASTNFRHLAPEMAIVAYGVAKGHEMADRVIAAFTLRLLGFGIGSEISQCVFDHVNALCAEASTLGVSEESIDSFRLWYSTGYVCRIEEAIGALNLSHPFLAPKIGLSA